VKHQSTGAREIASIALNVGENLFLSKGYAESRNYGNWAGDGMVVFKRKYLPALGMSV